jgi:hypothetical protein
VFWPYAALIATLTHWPGLAIEAPIQRPDLLVHGAVFGLWTLLCNACGFFGPAFSRRNAAWSLPVCLAYSALDEWTQLIPVLHRHAGVDDMLANWFGVGLGTIAALVLGRALAPRAPAGR